jgi:hypothetical protein
MSEPIFQSYESKNKALINALKGAPNGNMEKLAATMDESIIKRKLREDAICPAILPLDDYSKDDSAFMPHIDKEDPMVLIEMEPDQFGPKTLSWNDTGDIRTFKGNKFILTFVKNTTPVYTKNIDFLRTYKMDLVQMIEDNCVRDLNRQKDVIFFAGVEDIVGQPCELADSGYEQNVVYESRLTKDKHALACQLIPDRSLPLGVFVINRRTANDILLWDKDVFDRGAGDMTEKLTKEGLGAFDTLHLHGVDHIVTMKNDIIQNGVMYQFTTPDYLGRAGFLQPMKMYVEKKEDFIRWHATEKIGFAIANEIGVQKVTFWNSTGTYGNDGRLSKKPAQIVDHVEPTNPAA